MRDHTDPPASPPRRPLSGLSWMTGETTLNEGQPSTVIDRLGPGTEAERRSYWRVLLAVKLHRNAARWTFRSRRAA